MDISNNTARGRKIRNKLLEMTGGKDWYTGISLLTEKQLNGGDASDYTASIDLVKPFSKKQDKDNEKYKPGDKIVISCLLVNRWKGERDLNEWRIVCAYKRHGMEPLTLEQDLRMAMMIPDYHKKYFPLTFWGEEQGIPMYTLTKDFTEEDI